MTVFEVGAVRNGPLAREYTAETEEHRPMQRKHERYVRMSLQSLETMELAHLDSGIDADSASAAADVAIRGDAIVGFSEWVSRSSPRINIGWDWWLTRAGCMEVRSNTLRTNVMIVTGTGEDLGRSRSLKIVRNRIDAIAWQDTAIKTISDCDVDLIRLIAGIRQK